MHTTLPIEGVCQNESDIVNLDNAWTMPRDLVRISVCEKRELRYVL